MELACEQVQPFAEYPVECSSPSGNKARSRGRTWPLTLAASLALHSAAALALVFYQPAHRYTPPQVLLARGNQGEGEDERPESLGGLSGGMVIEPAGLHLADDAKPDPPFVFVTEARAEPTPSPVAADLSFDQRADDAPADSEPQDAAMPHPPVIDADAEPPVLIARGLEPPISPRAIGAAPKPSATGGGPSAGDEESGLAGTATTQPSGMAAGTKGGADPATASGGRAGTGGSGGGSASAGRAGLPDGLDYVSVPRPVYPRESRERGEQGQVVLQIEIRADASIGQIKVISDAGYPRLAAAAIAAVRHARIRPAMEDGRPIAGIVTQAFDFVLRK